MTEQEWKDLQPPFMDRDQIASDALDNSSIAYRIGLLFRFLLLGTGGAVWLLITLATLAQIFLR